MDEDLTQFARRGLVVVVATRDGDMRPEIVRGWGPEVASDRTAATLCVGAARESKALSNLAANGAIAVTMGMPTTYRMFQLKGRVSAIADPTAEQLARVEAHAAAFAAEVEQLGLSAEQARRLVHPELVSVMFAVHELYDQTPGPRAGARM
jgi:pyridoxamine 5'-phosphate oxidase-like protein